MKTFKIGNWVEITPQSDDKWDYWKNKHEMMKGGFAEIERVEPSKDGQQMFYYVRDLDGRATWFLDRHLILTQKQDRRFIDNMRQACEKLQEHERVCKKLLHEMLNDVFGEDRKEEEPLLSKEEQEEFFDDWEEEDTAEYIALPGGGVMVNPNYNNGIKKTKSSKKRTKTKIRKKTKTKSKKKTNTKQNNTNGGKIDTNSMDPADWMTDEELEAYLDDMYGIDWT